jgi:site-specific recombinase XerD
VVTIVRAVAGVPGIPARFPILLDGGMAIIEPAFAYLIEHATVLGRSRAAETVRTYAEHLYDWFDALDQSGLDWRAADEAMIAAYRNGMLEQPSPHAGRPYARATINDRVRTVCRFYEWADRRGLVEELPFRLSDARVFHGGAEGGLLGHLRRGASVVRANVFTVAEQERLPRPLRADELHQLFAALASPYRLIAEWSLGTGLRRKELCGLEAKQIPETRHFDLDGDPLVGVPLTVTKGDRPPTVYPPLRLVDRTHWYLGEDRAALMRRTRRARPGYRPPPNLFLNGHGEAVTRAGLSAAFGTAFHRAGLSGSLHWLRHTFAMAMLVRLQRQAASDPDLNPLKIVQVLLGHSSIATTAIYLRCVELHGAELARAWPTSTASWSPMPRRTRIDRRLPGATAAAVTIAEPAAVPAGTVVVFRDSWSEMVQRFDLAMLALPADLAGLFAKAFRAVDAGSTLATRHSRWQALRFFARFVAEDGAVRSTHELTTETVGRFIAWLGQQRSRTREPWAQATRAGPFALLRSLLVWAHGHRPEQLPSRLAIPYSPFPLRRQNQRPRTRLSEAHLKAILRACCEEIDEVWRRFEWGQAVGPGSRASTKDAARTGLGAMAGASPGSTTG